MRPTRLDVIVFVYTLGVALSGGLLAVESGASDRVFLVLLSLLIALPWTVYFRVAMLPKLTDELTEDETDNGVQE